MSATHPVTSVKAAAMAGFLSVPLGVAGVLIDRMWAFPETGASAAEIAGFIGVHRSALLVAMVLTTANVVLWLVFGVGVWLRLREATGGETVFSASFLAGLVSFVTLILAGFAVFFVLIYRAPEPFDSRLMYDISFGLLAISGVPTALALCSYAAQVFRDRSLPVWTAVVAVLAASGHLLLLASLAIRSGLFSLEGPVIIAVPAVLFAWILCMSIVLLRDCPREGPLSPEGGSLSR